MLICLSSLCLFCQFCGVWRGATRDGETQTEREREMRDRQTDRETKREVEEEEEEEWHMATGFEDLT